jgi:hypothetical protein
MNMIAKKQRAPAPISSPVNSADVLAALDRRLAELDARDALLLEQQIVLEGSSAATAPEAEAATAQAQAVLDGADYVVRREAPISRLEAIYAERKLLKLALRIGNSERHRQLTERAAAIWAERFPDIAHLERRRVRLAIELQRLNRDRERLRDQITAAGGAGFLATDGVELLGLGDRSDDEVSWAVQRVLADGIATPAEIEGWRSGRG